MKDVPFSTNTWSEPGTTVPPLLQLHNILTCETQTSALLLHHPDPTALASWVIKPGIFYVTIPRDLAECRDHLAVLGTVGRRSQLFRPSRDSRIEQITSLSCYFWVDSLQRQATYSAQTFAVVKMLNISRRN